MTLYVRMRIPRFGPAIEVLKSKVNVAMTLLSFLSKIFNPREINLWYNAPAESLDGKLVKRTKVNPDTSPSSISLLIDRIIKTSSLEATKIIIIIEGSLKLSMKKENVPAYLAIYNAIEWRSVYHDIEFDIYPTHLLENVENLSDIYIMDSELREKLNAIIRKLMSLGRNKIDKIIIGTSPDAMNIITERVETTNPTGPSFIIDIIRTIRYEADELGFDYAKKISTYIKPYKEMIVASRLWGLKEFKPFFESIIKVSEIRWDPYLTDGLMLYTVNKGAFNKFYKIMVEKFFEPFSFELIDLDTLVRKMRKVITGTKSLDEYYSKI